MTKKGTKPNKRRAGAVEKRTQAVHENQGPPDKPNEVAARPPQTASIDGVPKTNLLRRKLAINIVLFSLLSILMLIAEQTRWGQEVLDGALDRIVEDNFYQRIIKGQAPKSVSGEMNLVLFEEDDYTKSYTKGYWTPRDEVGLTLLNSIRRKAKVVILDYNFATSEPEVCENGRPVRGDALYVEYLDQAGQKARLEGSFIIVPASNPGEDGIENYLEILRRYPEVFYEANFQGLRHDGDGLVRRMSWYAYNDDYAPILSAHLLAILLLRNDRHLEVIKEAKATLIGLNSAPLFLPPSLFRALLPENQAASSRLFYSLLPQPVLQNKEYVSIPDIWRSVVWRPGQINGPNEAEPDFENKIVIIGANYDEYGDIHKTVFGDISGSYLLANATNMLLDENHPRDAHRFNVLFIVITGVLACYLYTRYKPLGPTIFFSAVALVSQFSSFFLFNKYGLFFDAWIPAFGIGIYNVGLAYKDRIFACKFKDNQAIIVYIQLIVATNSLDDKVKLAIYTADILHLPMMGHGLG